MSPPFAARDHSHPFFVVQGFIRALGLPPSARSSIALPQRALSGMQTTTLGLTSRDWEVDNFLSIYVSNLHYCLIVNTTKHCMCCNVDWWCASRLVWTCRRSRTYDLDEAMVLDMGQYETPAAATAADKRAPAAAGTPKLAGAGAAALCKKLRCT